MSHCVDETYEVYFETTRTARKEHRCAACKETIRPRDRYARVFILFEGDAESIIRCLRCQVIHEELRSHGEHDMWPDERLNCGEEYEEHWGVKPPEPLAALAFATPAEVARSVDAARGVEVGLRAVTNGWVAT